MTNCISIFLGDLWLAETKMNPNIWCVCFLFICTQSPILRAFDEFARKSDDAMIYKKVDESFNSDGTTEVNEDPEHTDTDSLGDKDFDADNDRNITKAPEVPESTDTNDVEDIEFGAIDGENNTAVTESHEHTDTDDEEDKNFDADDNKNITAGLEGYNAGMER